MNQRMQTLAEHAGYEKDMFGVGHWDMPECKKFVELIVRECVAQCGSQADRKSILNQFGLPVESNIKYSGPDAHWSVTSQYTRDYNIPNDK